MEPVTPTLPDDDVAAIDRLGAIYKELSSELSKMIIGQQRVVELLSIALFSRGHALLMGVRAWRRRCWSVPWQKRWTLVSTASSSRRT